MESIKNIIIGAGPSGLSLAYHLQGNSLILEKEEKVGGLCRSINKNGSVFDIGGHSFHTPHIEVDEIINNIIPGGLFYQKREARVFSHETLFSYPFQRNYNQIQNKDVVRECEEGLLNAAGSENEASNFEEYLFRKFGDGIAEHFMLPYNRKLWARDLKLISCEWTAERIAESKGDKNSSLQNGSIRKPLQANSQVGYPQKGGFEEIFRAFVPLIPSIKTNCKIVKIDPKNKIAHTKNGYQYSWNNLFSTIPLPELVKIVDGVPSRIIEIANNLPFMSLRVELFQIGQKLKTEIQRIYVADSKIPPHKIALNHNSSKYLHDKPNHAIMSEVSHSKNKPVNFATIAEKTIDFLCNINILNSPSDVIWQSHLDIKYAYPVYTHERFAMVQEIKDWMEQFGIYTLGRFGDWEYINSDKCISKGMVMADQMRSNNN